MPIFSRTDGTLVRDVPATRRIMPFILPTKDAATVYFEQELDVTQAQAFLDRQPKSKTGKLTLFHLFTHAVVKTIGERPKLNRFLAGANIYQRNAIELSFAAKKSMNDEAPVVVIKRAFDPEATFEEHVSTLSGGIAEGRSPKANSTDKELSLFLKLPAFMLRWFVALALWLDSKNLLPSAFTKPDPLFCSVFVTNLGSVGLDAVYHHLFEWGNCPIFAALGRVHEIERDGRRRKVCTVRWTFDERIEDGLYCARSLERLKEMVESLTKS